jgi:hypothetical protein
MYARVKDNTVIEIVKPVDGFSLEQCFHADLLEGGSYVDDTVQVGWVLHEGTFVDPATITETTTETTTQTDTTTTDTTQGA